MKVAARVVMAALVVLTYAATVSAAAAESADKKLQIEQLERRDLPQPKDVQDRGAFGRAATRDRIEMRLLKR